MEAKAHGWAARKKNADFKSGERKISDCLLNIFTIALIFYFKIGRWRIPALPWGPRGGSWTSTERQYLQRQEKTCCTRWWRGHWWWFCATNQSCWNVRRPYPFVTQRWLHRCTGWNGWVIILCPMFCLLAISIKFLSIIWLPHSLVSLFMKEDWCLYWA